ncbi:MAG: outer membrane protein [Alphaproteobacteria bacterium]
MKNKKSIIALSLWAAATVLITLSTAQADNRKFYVAANAGLSLQQKTSFNYASGANVKTDFDNGYGLSASFGYDTGKIWSLGGFRPEIEVGYRESDVNTHRLNGGSPLAGPTGRVSNLYAMANIIHDFHTGSKFTPYLGAGLGIARVDASGFGVSAIPAVLSDKDNALAYQAIAGVSYQLNNKTALTLDYRYFATEKAKVQSAVGNNTEIRNATNNVTVGVRYGL